ncbi:hypothetical protein J2129_000801 [Methanofollis sp. W23]|nr:hypothetical protein [Methanofollis sp. W23]
MRRYSPVMSCIESGARTRIPHSSCPIPQSKRIFDLRQPDEIDLRDVRDLPGEKRKKIGPVEILWRVIFGWGRAARKFPIFSDSLAFVPLNPRREDEGREVSRAHTRNAGGVPMKMIPTILSSGFHESVNVLYHVEADTRRIENSSDGPTAPDPQIFPALSRPEGGDETRSFKDLSKVLSRRLGSRPHAVAHLRTFSSRMREPNKGSCPILQSQKKAL